MEANGAPIRIRYHFNFPGLDSMDYEIHLDRKTLTLVEPKPADEPPAWTELGFEQCPHCPLSPEQARQCPIAANIATLVEDFKDRVSFESIQVTVRTEERTYMKLTSVQEGLYSLFGIVMATSGCPVMNFLKPMARFHLPFSSLEETIVRSTSIYLLRQHVLARKGQGDGESLDSLESKYQDVVRVNEFLFKRIRSVVTSGDADQNAMTTLSMIGQALSLGLEERVSKIEYLFQTD